MSKSKTEKALSRITLLFTCLIIVWILFFINIERFMPYEPRLPLVPDGGGMMNPYYEGVIISFAAIGSTIGVTNIIKNKKWTLGFLFNLFTLLSFSIVYAIN